MPVVALSATMPAGRVFALDMQTLVGIAFQLFNVAFLAAVLSFLLYQPVRDFLRRRTERIEAQFADIASSMETANEQRLQYEALMKEIDVERIGILAAAREDAAAQCALMIAAAELEAKTIRERAQRDILKEYERINDELRQYIVDAALVIAAKYISDAADKDIHDQLFREALAELENVPWGN